MNEPSMHRHRRSQGGGKGTTALCHSRQIDLCRPCLHSRDLLQCWLRWKVAGVAY